MTFISAKARVKARESRSIDPLIAGSQRGFALAALQGIRKHAFSVAYDGVFVPFGARGVLTAEDFPNGDEAEEGAATFKDVASKKFFVHSDLTSGLSAGDLPVNKTFSFGGNNYDIPTGVCAIIGGTGAGKTPLAHYLASLGVDDYGIVLASEPFVGNSMGRAEIAGAIGAGMLAYADVVVDSVKDLLSSGGNLMKSGLSRAALTELSAWGVTASSLGCTLYIPINPSDNSPEVMETITNAVRSSVSSSFTATGQDLAGTSSSWRFEQRTVEGGRRRSGVFTFSTDSDSSRVDAGSQPVRQINMSSRNDVLAQQQFAALTSRI